jgi:hypothetical protein
MYYYDASTMLSSTPDSAGNDNTMPSRREARYMPAASCPSIHHHATQTGVKLYTHWGFY